MFNLEEYKKNAKKIAKEAVGSISENKKEMSEENVLNRFESRIVKEEDYETIDRDIYSIEHGFVYDGVCDWNGSKINEDWEAYKERVGYYKRHPEEEEYSRAFTKMFMKAQGKSDE